MPTLGFLKKKRTKDSTGSKDLDSPTSPINTAGASPFSPTKSNTRGSVVSKTSTNQDQPTSQTSQPSSTTPTTSHKPADSMNPSSYPQQAYATPQASPEPHQQTQQQQQQHTVPSIQNLIHPANTTTPQQSQQQQQQPNASSRPTNGGAPQAQPAPTVRATKGKYTLQDFTIQRTLGTGSFGRVHLVQSKHNQRFYAVKVLKKAQVVKMKQVEHTNDERRMLQQVKHPFLITLWGTFQDSKNLYMVMDFVEGGELFSLLRKSQRFPNPVAKFYAAEVTLALDYLHAQNIIYRDLKPENLLLDRHGHLKITDFGFAKEVPDITWTLCGTPDYLAPEVVASKGYNKSVDWWSLGILIFEMLCGFTPFWDGGSPMKIYENILKGRVKYPPYIHHDAQDLLQKLITPDLTKRLGNLHGGSKDVMNHPWFAEVTWERLQKKDIDAPYVPPVRAGVGDASQFDKYPEETEAYGQTGEDPHGSLFPDF
ncbi:Pkinase-domain-containing protein [Periconia macrospinosa]|uniref:cAMP-dependent protein kinase n=1 Tax=Periconia macrospinosa TaxID=97972 RepID=A0A2V1E531_9PLEO|nr:Pkinase-domain-containing protein [Periconia macrospinosa]